MTRARLALAALPLVALAWGFWLEPASLRNEDHHLTPARWPAACDGLRVAVLADLHVGSPGNGRRKLDDIVALTQKAKPDLVLLAGDFVIHEVVGGRFVSPEETATALGALQAPGGVFAVLGNHDWWLGAARVRAALEGAGIPVLDDAATPIVRGACRVWLVGISDFVEGPHDLARAFRDVPADATVLAFTHNPDVFPDIPARVSLTVAGHTHGGQVYVPGIGRPVVPSAYGQRFAIGHVVEDGRHLFVSSGLGTSILPVRFLVPPEVSVLSLDASGAAPTTAAP